MKIVLRILLVIAIIALIYMCYESIMSPIRFDAQKKSREQAIVERLIAIRDAQIGYKNLHGVYAGSFDELKKFLNEEKLPFLLKEGELTDDQLEKGLTEKKALEIIAKAHKTGKFDEVAKFKLENFKRDTTWVLAKDTLIGHDYNVAEISKVPGFDATFALDTATLTSPSGYTVPVFECSVPYDDYLSGLDKQLLINLKDKQTKLNRYCGLRVGSVTEINNNAGNWEQF